MAGNQDLIIAQKRLQEDRKQVNNEKTSVAIERKKIEEQKKELTDLTEKLNQRINKFKIDSEKPKWDLNQKLVFWGIMAAIFVGLISPALTAYLYYLDHQSKTIIASVPKDYKKEYDILNSRDSTINELMIQQHQLQQKVDSLTKRLSKIK